MIDANTLPYIDLGAPADILRQYSMEQFGKKISATAKDETVVERFKAIYLEETGIELTVMPGSGAPEFDDEDEGDTPPAAAPQVAKKRLPIAATIIVHEDEKDPSPICGSVNFVAYRIKRNTEARVSMKILQSLKNAKKTVYDPETMESKEVLQYPFSIVEYHFADEA